MVLESKDTFIFFMKKLVVCVMIVKLGFFYLWETKFRAHFRLLLIKQNIIEIGAHPEEHVSFSIL